MIRTLLYSYKVIKKLKIKQPLQVSFIIILLRMSILMWLLEKFYFKLFPQFLIDWYHLLNYNIKITSLSYELNKNQKKKKLTTKHKTESNKKIKKIIFPNLLSFKFIILSYRIGISHWYSLTLACIWRQIRFIEESCE